MSAAARFLMHLTRRTEHLLWLRNCGRSMRATVDQGEAGHRAKRKRGMTTIMPGRTESIRVCAWFVTSVCVLALGGCSVVHLCI